MIVRCYAQVPGDAAGLPAGLHRPSEASAGSERAVRESAVRLREEVGERHVSWLAGGFHLNTLKRVHL